MMQRESIQRKGMARAFVTATASANVWGSGEGRATRCEGRVVVRVRRVGRLAQQWERAAYVGEGVVGGGFCGGRCRRGGEGRTSMRRVGRGCVKGGRGQGEWRPVEVVQDVSQVRRRGREEGARAWVGMGGAMPMEGNGEGGKEGWV